MANLFNKLNVVKYSIFLAKLGIVNPSSWF